MVKNIFTDTQSILCIAFAILLITTLEVVTSSNPVKASLPTSNIKDNSILLSLSKGYVNGNISYFLPTDASNNQTAKSITENAGYKVNYAPSLTSVPESSQQQGYEFLNGVKGEGAFGFQLGVASALPEDKGYSPIVKLNFVKWNENTTARELKSAQDVLKAQSNGELKITKTDIIINSPVIIKR